MIDRYTRPEMGNIWSAEARFEAMLQVEIHTLDALVQRGVVPQAVPDEVREKGRINVDRIAEIEAVY